MDSGAETVSLEHCFIVPCLCSPLWWLSSQTGSLHCGENSCFLAPTASREDCLPIGSSPPKDPGKPLIGLDWVARECSGLIGQAIGTYSPLEPEGGIRERWFPERRRGCVTRGRWAKRKNILNREFKKSEFVKVG